MTWSWTRKVRCQIGGEGLEVTIGVPQELARKKTHLLLAPPSASFLLLQIILKTTKSTYSTYRSIQRTTNPQYRRETMPQAIAAL